jgi:hypothetical protein
MSPPKGGGDHVMKKTTVQIDGMMSIFDDAVRRETNQAPRRCGEGGRQLPKWDSDHPTMNRASLRMTSINSSPVAATTVAARFWLGKH